MTASDKGKLTGDMGCNDTIKRFIPEGSFSAVSNRLTVQGIDAEVIVRTGNPATEIIKIAGEEDASVIWMSSHGSGWFSELLLGSTAYTVAMNAQRPVIIIRKPEAGAADPPFSPA